MKVLDCTDESGFLCGKILADLGADVIKIDPPSTNFIDDNQDDLQKKAALERDVYHSVYNTGKRNITLNLEMESGRDLFRRLAEHIDIIIESYPPHYMDALDLGYKSLSLKNEGLIYTAVTPFGQDGPYSSYKATDITAMAMSGDLFLTGDDDRPPVRIGFPQAYLYAGAQASVGTLMAFYHRELTGEGQFVDVSMQESILGTTFQALYSWVTDNRIVPRTGSARMMGKDRKVSMTWACKDGYVNFSILGGARGGRSMKNLGKWMSEVGMGNATITDTDWVSYDFNGITKELIDDVTEPIKKFFLQYTMNELFEESIKREVMLFPAANAAVILNDPHLESKDFWQIVEYPGAKKSIKYPSPPYRINEKYPSFQRGAALHGQHNNEIYEGILGLSSTEIISYTLEGVI
jgi:crotonobetainyl-CoA:carnitine CoA-transferase CaiB-like acyl-CoA transferase